MKITWIQTALLFTFLAGAMDSVAIGPAGNVKLFENVVNSTEENADCRSCDIYQGTRGAVYDYNDLLVRVGFKNPEDEKNREPMGRHASAVAVGKLVGYGGISTGTLVDSAGVLTASFHQFFDKQCRPYNGDSKKWWSDTMFFAEDVDGNVPYEIEEGTPISKCKPGSSYDPKDDLVVLKLKRKVTFDGKVARPFKLGPPLTLERYKSIKDNIKNNKVYFFAYGSTVETQVSQNESSRQSGSVSKRFLNSVVPMNKLIEYGDQTIIHHDAASNGSASAGTFCLIKDDNCEVFAFHIGNVQTSTGRYLYNRALGLTPEIKQLVTRYSKQSFAGAGPSISY